MVLLASFNQLLMSLPCLVLGWKLFMADRVAVDAEHFKSIIYEVPFQELP